MLERISDSIKSGSSNDKVILYGFRPRKGVSSVSPLVGKIELYLRMNDIPYEVRIVCSPRNAPKRKVPYIVHGKNTVADTKFIIKYINETYKDKLHVKEPESPLRSAAVRAATILVEDHLFQLTNALLFLTEDGWHETREFIKNSLPYIIRFFFVDNVREFFRRSLDMQGIARHSRNDILELIKDDIDILANLLGENDYFGGESVCEADATVFFYLDTFFSNLSGIPNVSYFHKYPNLIEYYKRIKIRYFPDTKPSKFKIQSS